MLLVIFTACSSAFKDDAQGDRDYDGAIDAEDCAPDNPDIHPNASEVCDGIDQDCDGQADDGVTDARFEDNDGDGYGGDAIDACPDTPNVSSTDGDCDDDNASVYPGAIDACDGVDNDCDGTTDEDGVEPIYRDFDGDGYGDATQPSTGCPDPNWSANAGDCDDYDTTVHPGVAETCNTLDDDCDGSADNGGVCPCDVAWWPDTEHAYMFCDVPLDWASADAACALYGYRLVTFDSAAEGEWVEATVLTYPSGPSWWIGFTDSGSEGAWVWADGSPVSYTNWTSGEPNNGHGGECVAESEEDCAMIRWSGSSWNDYPCTCANEYSVCEARSEARPD